MAFGLPISFLGMFIFAGQFDVTINVLSLFGMIIVVGILVDDGIVVGENIYQHYEKGKSPIQAAIDGTMEVIPPVVSAIITTLLAFSLFLFLDSRIGEFFGEVSIVVILTLLVSMIEALIILPAHVAHSKALQRKDRRPNKVNAFFIKLNKGADKYLIAFRDTIYVPYLRFFLKNKFLGFAIPIALFIFSIGAIGGGIVGMSFFPRLASDTVTVNLKMPQGTNEKITDSIISTIEDKVWIIDKAAPGHFGVGPGPNQGANETFFPSWYAAGPDSRAADGFYDDEITFSKDANNNVSMDLDNKGNTFVLGAAVSYYGLTGGEGQLPIATAGAKRLSFMNATSNSTAAISTRIQFQVPGNGLVMVGAGSNMYEIISLTSTTMTLRTIGVDGNAWYQMFKVK